MSTRPTPPATLNNVLLECKARELYDVWCRGMERVDLYWIEWEVVDPIEHEPWLDLAAHLLGVRR